MASAKSKNKAVATKKVIKKAAPKKAVKPKPNPVKKVAVKKVVKKAAPAKTAVKVKSAVSKKATVVVKKTVNAPKKKADLKAPVKKAIVVKKEKITPLKAEKTKITAPLVDVKNAKPLKTKVIAPGKNSKPEIKSSAKSTKESEKIDPLHAKAAKVMKELEETMDLSKMRPRIQAGTTTLKTLPKPKEEDHPKLPEPTNTTKEKYSLEFEFRSSPKILFTSLSDPSGLAGWFADEVLVKDKTYTFVWEGGESSARLIAVRDLQLVRFEWAEDSDGTYFQFEIKEDDITLDIALVITDFAGKGEKDTNIRLWESQVQKLRMLLGSL